MNLLPLKPIKIELELQPEIALLLGSLIYNSAHGIMSVYKLLSEEAEDDLAEIGQEITDQVASKTNFNGIDMSEIDDETKKDLKQFMKMMNIKIQTKS